MNKHNKINEIEALLGGMAALALDVFLIFIKLIGLGFIFYMPLRGMGFYVSSLYFHSKGDHHAMSLDRWLKRRVSTAWIPFIPVFFLTFLYEYYRHNHPKIAGGVKKIAKK